MDYLKEAAGIAKQLLNEHDAFSGTASDTITALLAHIDAKDAEIARLREAVGYLVGDMIAANMEDYASVSIARAALNGKE